MIYRCYALSSLAGRQVDYQQEKTAANSELETRLDALQLTGACQQSDARTRQQPEVDQITETVDQLTQAGTCYRQIATGERQHGVLTRVF